MNKRAARAKALEGELSIGDLRQMINTAKGRGGKSKVNPAFPLEQTLGLYEAALDGRPDEEVPKVWKLDIYSRKGYMKPNAREVLIITNILRDAG